eukprot:TRINITY_DN51002_c0_g1_i1.p1 TRINITY_DN51002_c0_g1~~TRINITY_DN51002_c0_g1_i1.p1  ORF type:complete len:149 (+),score=46.19 TRINITY_DN51002_c0_g1_i1:56-448(+)
MAAPVTAEEEAKPLEDEAPEEQGPLTWEGESEANKIIQAICNKEKVQEKVKAAVEVQAKAVRADIKFEKLEALKYKYSTTDKDTEFWVKCKINDVPDFVHILLTQEASLEGTRVKDVKAFERADSRIQTH